MVADLFDQLNDGEITVDDMVDDRVQHRERAHGETIGVLLERLAHARQFGVISVADGHHEVRTETP